MNVEGEIHDQPADLAALTGRHARYGAVHAFPLIEPETGRSSGAASWGNAILTRMPLRDGFVTGLPRAADDDLLEPTGTDHPLAGVRYTDAEGGHREGRAAVGGRLPLDERTSVRIVTSHLTYIGRGQRLGQAEALANLAISLGEPVIVAGDFNAPLDAPELAPLTAAFDDALGSTGLAQEDSSRRTFGVGSIDHVLTHGLTTIAGRVADEAGDASDHFPLVVDLAAQPA